MFFTASQPKNPQQETISQAKTREMLEKKEQLSEEIRRRFREEMVATHNCPHCGKEIEVRR